MLLLGRGDFGNGRDGVLGTDHRLRCVTNRVDSADDRVIPYLAEMVGAELPARLPEPYLDEAADRFGARLDPDMGDEIVALRSEHRTKVENEIGRTIEVARQNLFPLHGLTA